MWMPYLHYVDAMRVRIKTQEKTLVWMQAADKEINKIESQSKNKSKSLTPVILLGLLQKQINQAGLEQNLTQSRWIATDPDRNVGRDRDVEGDTFLDRFAANER